MNAFVRWGLGAAAAPLIWACAAGAGRAESTDDLSRLSLEELASLEVTSVSRRPEPISGAAASVFVLNNDDVRRSGAQSLPDVLRLAPNLTVTRVDALDYTVSARGLHGFESSNKLLVLVDGRSVYSPFFAGVEWTQINAPLADIDRIEVISGPGGALWGANAVNGVINITSRSAFETQGVLVDAAAGSGDDAVTVRFGARIGETLAGRFYVRAFDRADSLDREERNFGDGWSGVQAGFRTDLDRGRDRFTLQGDVYRSDLYLLSGVPAAGDGGLEGGNLTGRWDRAFGDDSRLSVIAYRDRYERKARFLLDTVTTDSIAAQYAFARGRHQLVVGGEYRRWRDDFFNFIGGFVLDPLSDENDLSSIFVQDQIALRDDLTLTLGVKAENSSFSGLEWLPTGRLAWRPSLRQTIWAAASRSVRTPSRLDRDLVFRPLTEKGDFQPEELVAYEIGWRGRPSDRLSLSAALWRHEYDGLRSVEPTPVTTTPLRLQNGLEGETWGLEAWSEFDVRPGWRLSAGLNLLDREFRRSPGGNDRSAMASTGADPHAHGYVRSQWTVGDRLEIDLRLNAMDEIERPASNVYDGAPGWVDADARVAWRLTDTVELSVAGFNLLHGSRQEGAERRAREVRRSVQAGLRVSW